MWDVDANKYACDQSGSVLFFVASFVAFIYFKKCLLLRQEKNNQTAYRSNALSANVVSFLIRSFVY